MNISQVIRTAGFAVSFFVALAPARAETPEQNRLHAALLEWTVANCGSEKVSAMLFSMATMIIHGSTEEEMANPRDTVRKGTAENYPSKDAACADLLPRFQVPPQ